MSASVSRPALPFERLLLCGSAGVSVALLPAWVAWIQQFFDVDVRVVLTRGAEDLVSPKALAVLTRHEVLTSAPADEPDPVVRHLEAARWADAVLVAPATANLIAKLAHGLADDLLTTIVLACEAPVVLAPSLPPAVSAKPAVRRNLALLADDGYGLVPTAQGTEAATGTHAPGAMADAPTALAYLKRFSAADGRRVEAA